MPDAIVLKRATIEKKGNANWKFTVLFNPGEYALERSVQYAEHAIPGLDKPVMQFISGQSDTLRMNLFFDTYSGGAEAGGDAKQKTELTNSSTAAEAQKRDVSQYTSKIYELMNVDGTTHLPPVVVFKWGSLSFEGYVVSVAQQYTKFTYTGIPVRAKLEVTFKSNVKPKDQLLFTPRFSPDRTQFFTVHEGDTLTEIAQREYGDPERWRTIAEANGIENPRLLTTGAKLEIPALI